MIFILIELRWTCIEHDKSQVERLRKVINQFPTITRNAGRNSELNFSKTNKGMSGWKEVVMYQEKSTYC